MVQVLFIARAARLGRDKKSKKRDLKASVLHRRRKVYLISREWRNACLPGAKPQTATARRKRLAHC